MPKDGSVSISFGPGDLANRRKLRQIRRIRKSQKQNVNKAAHTVLTQGGVARRDAGGKLGLKKRSALAAAKEKEVRAEACIAVAGEMYSDGLVYTIEALRDMVSRDERGLMRLDEETGKLWLTITEDQVESFKKDTGREVQLGVR